MTSRLSRYQIRYIMYILYTIMYILFQGVRRDENLPAFGGILHLTRSTCHAPEFLGQDHVHETSRSGCRLSRFRLGFLQSTGLPVSV